MHPQDKNFLQRSIQLARQSMAEGGFPAGALVVKDGKIIGEGISTGNKLHDPTHYGEMAAIRAACLTLKATNLAGSVLYSSIQPCLMCFGAALWGGITKIIYACAKQKVSTAYYGGHYHIDQISTELLNPIDLIHGIDLQDASLAIIHEWEQSIS